jgi:hypothetical protein
MGESCFGGAGGRGAVEGLGGFVFPPALFGCVALHGVAPGCMGLHGDCCFRSALNAATPELGIVFLNGIMARTSLCPPRNHTKQIPHKAKGIFRLLKIGC